jgi:hypothetical protein
MGTGVRTEKARKCVSALLESADRRALGRLRKDLDEHTSATQAFYRDLAELISERNWLVHRSFHSPSVARVESISARSDRLSNEVSAFLVERFRPKGMQAEEVASRATRVVEEWVAGQSAA